MAICSKCGTESNDAKFCPECGTPMSASPVVDNGEAAAIAPEQAPQQPAQAPQPQAPKQDPNGAKAAKGKLPKWAKITLIVVGVLLVFSAIGSCMGIEQNNAQQQQQQAQQDADAKAAQEAEAKKKEEEAAKKVADAKESLQGTIESAQGTDPAAYTEDTFAALTTAIDNAKAVIDDQNATEAQVTSAAKAINTAIDGLKEVFNPANYQWPAYADVARNPDAYKGQKIAFTGKVLQVMDGDNEIDIRVATDGAWDSIVFAGYDPSVIDYRILEDDMVTIYGTCIGLYSYTSTMGAKISLPGMYLDMIELQ